MSVAADRDPAAARLDQPRQQQRQLALAAAALADDGDMTVDRHGKADPVENPAAVVLGERQIGDRELAFECGIRVCGLVELQMRVDHSGRCELLDDLLVLDPRILLDLVEVEQLLPRRGQVLVGGEHRHQRAERQAAADHQIAADRIKEERGQLRDEIVKEFDEEFALVDFEADAVDRAEQMSEPGELEFDGVVALDVDDAGGGFVDPVGDLPDRADALLVELVDLALQPRDHVALDRVERDRRGAEHRILHEHEQDDRQQRPALESRRDERVADKPAQRLALGGDHRDDLSRRGLVELVERETQQPMIELVAEAPQHPLAELPLQGVDVIFERPVDKHQHQKYRGQHQADRGSVELEAEQRLREMMAADRAVDDRLRQFERIIKKRKRDQGQHQQPQLLAQAVAQDEAVDRRFEGCWGRRFALRRRRRAALPLARAPAVEPAPGVGGAAAARRLLDAADDGRHSFDRRELHKKIISPPDSPCNSRAADMHEVA